MISTTTKRISPRWVDSITHVDLVGQSGQTSAHRTVLPAVVLMGQFGPICRELVDGGKHFPKDALCEDCLIVGKLRNVDTLLIHAQRRSPEQFINLHTTVVSGIFMRKLQSLRNPRREWEQV